MSAPTLAPPLLDVFVPGTPAPKGSTRSFAMRANNARGMRAVTIADNKGPQREWSAMVSAVAMQACGVDTVLTSAAVHVHVEFVMPRRKNAPKTRTDAHTRKPDGDKLTRCVWDCLTGIVFADDAQVASWSGGKREAELGETPGAHIRVHLIGATP